MQRLNHFVRRPDRLRPGYNGELIVTTNPALSTADGHTADFAEQTAQLLGVPVMVFERPYTSEDAKFSWSRYSQAKVDVMPRVEETADSIVLAIDKLTDITGDICLAGHSAAGTFLLGVAASGKIERLRWLYASDPPAIKANNQMIYTARYFGRTSVDYARPWLTGDRPDGGNLNRASKPSGLTMAKYLAQEWAVHAGFISSDQCLRWMIKCAEQQADVAINIRFPRKTFTAVNDWHLAIKNKLEGFDRPAPLEITVGAENYHADYVNNAATAQHIGRLMFPDQEKA